MTKKEKLKIFMKDKNIVPTNMFLSTHEMAELLGVTCTTIIAWCNNDLISCSRTMGGHRRIPMSEYERLSDNFKIKNAKITETKEAKTKYPINRYIKK